MVKKKKDSLSPLENKVMRAIWDAGTATADEIRRAMSTPAQPMKDSTARTVLRRLEEKGFLKHAVDGRTYVYSPTVESKNVAMNALRGIIDRFCDGSVEDLLVGMVDDQLVSADKLQQLADRIKKAKKTSRKKNTQKKRRSKEN